MGAIPVDRRQDDEARMNLLAADEPSKILRILCDDNAIFLDAASQHGVIRLAARPIWSG